MLSDRGTSCPPKPQGHQFRINLIFGKVSNLSTSTGERSESCDCATRHGHHIPIPCRVHAIPMLCPCLLCPCFVHTVSILCPCHIHTAVSYTHLIKLLVATLHPIFLFDPIVSRSLPLSPVSGVLFNKTLRIFTPSAVSYTHLDVYKRQLRRPRAEPRWALHPSSMKVGSPLPGVSSGIG